MADFSSFNLSQIKRDAILANKECGSRGLQQSARWFAELSFSLDQVDAPENLSKLLETENHEDVAEYDRYTLAKSYFDLKEYDRASYFVQNCTSKKAYFLHVYSKYLAGEKRRQDDASDSIAPQDNLENEHLRVLRLDLQRHYKSDSGMDGYCLYLYGVILKKLDLVKEALEVFLEAVHKTPLHWGAWLELSLLVTDKEQLSGLVLPDHWLRHFYMAHTYLELQLNEEAMELNQRLADNGFSRFTYVMAQTAVAYHNNRDVDQAVVAFNKLHQVDPYRLENMDTCSNLLYVKEMRAALAHLAHHCCEIDKYRVETCCVIGNYYSLRAQHEKAVLYFQRALKLNPNYLSAWTLMGHEYIEIKNTSAAMQAYRQAVEVNKRDYRAWYGLGQIYEILKMPYYCLYYYRKAQMLRPNDSRMVVALGEAYEKLERLQEAKKCFWKAHCLGDIEGLALIKLARLYERLSEEDQAAAAYTEYINETEKQGTYNYEEQSQAYKYLANYHVKRNDLDEGYVAAQKCTEFNETREEGKALLRQISRLRALASDGGLPVPIVDTGGTGGSLSTDRPQPQLDPQDSTPQTRLSPMHLTFTP